MKYIVTICIRRSTRKNMHFTSKDHNERVHFLKEITKDYKSGYAPSQKECDEHLDGLKSFMTRDNFFWVVNLVEQKVERSGNVAKILGYPDNMNRDSESLTLYDIYKIVHRDMQAATQAQRTKTAEYIHQNLQGQIEPLSDDFVYSVVVCFETKDRKPILAKQRTTAFQVDENGNMVSYLSWHEVIKDYGGEGANLEIIINGTRQYELEEEIQIGAVELVKSPLKKSQQEILKFLADENVVRGYECSPPTNKELSILLKERGITVSVEAVKKRLDRAKKAAEEHYDRKFKRPIDLALYLRKFRLI